MKLRIFYFFCIFSFLSPVIVNGAINYAEKQQKDKLITENQIIGHNATSIKTDDLDLSLAELKSQNDGCGFSTSSVLGSGNWQKISVNESGIHRIPYSMLQSWGFSQPSKVAVYGYGGQMLPSQNNIERPDDLPEVGIWHYNNAIYFYANGPASWYWDDEKKMFLQKLHYWSSFSFYFLTEKNDKIKEPIQMPPLDGIPTVNVTHYDERHYHEAELINIMKSGRKWFGERFDASSGRLEHSFKFTLNNRDVSQAVRITSSMAARSGSSSSFSFFLNDSKSAFYSMSILPVQDMSRESGNFAVENSFITNVISDEKDLNLKVRYNPTTAIATGYMDYITINARSKLILNAHQLSFRDRESYEKGELALFSIENGKSETVVWDITHIESPVLIPSSFVSGRVEFKMKTDKAYEFIAFNPGGEFPVPQRIGKIENQNLHSHQQADYVIVVADDFQPYAEELAELHQAYNNLTPLVVPVSKIYNEFSWGHQDPTAIRLFMRMLYLRAADDNDKKPRYLLLFGSGSYNNKSKIPGVENGIVTYQSENSTHHTNTYVTDDYFGFLDCEQGGDDVNDILYLGIGRFPVRNITQAKNAVEKVRKYFEEQDVGAWRKNITFFAEDGDNHLHMSQADMLSKKVAENYPEYDIKKIYLDSYPETTISTGNRSPEAEDAVNRAISEGTVLFNFVGHGGSHALTKKEVVNRTSVKELNNIRRLPLFVTATCTFSRFDDHDGEPSAGELVFFNTRGGAIALLSTTRVVFANQNFILNNRFFDFVFNYDENGKRPALGDITRYTKNGLASGVNKLNFVLLGDPAIKLIYPSHNVKTTKINHQNIEEFGDTIKALSSVSIEGEVVDGKGLRIDDYNGEMEITVYDKQQEVATLGHEGIEPFQFKNFFSVLFKGKASVREGRFEMEFIIPFDIRYNYGDGKISYYAQSNDYGDAFGAFEKLKIGGFNTDFNPDDKGPEVKLYLNHPEFKNGDVTGSTPILYAELFDDSGINTSGTGIGHDIILILNENYNQALILNDYFKAKSDTYKEGVIEYQLPEVPEGLNNLSIRVWDTYNNSTTEELEFFVGKGKDLKIWNFIWYPNPISFNANGGFAFETGEPNSALEIDIDLYTIDGLVVGKHRIETVARGNYVADSGLSLMNMGAKTPGLYFVRFSIRTPEGKKAQIVEKIMLRP